MSTETVDDVTKNLAVETVASIDDVADEPGGAWPKGWYAATITEGYQTKRGKVVETGDALSKNGDSRNARFCFVAVGPGGERQMNTSFNYRTTDFSADRVAYIKEARTEHRDVKGKWNDDPDAQRSSLALAKIGAFGKAIGTKDGDTLKGVRLHTDDGVINTSLAVGKRLWIFLTVDENGYNEAARFDHIDNRK